MSATEWEPDKPWERQPFDTDVSWPVFQRFLLMDPRSLQGLLRGPCPYTWAQLQDIAWSTHWKERVELYDSHAWKEAERIKRKANLDDVKASSRIRSKMQQLAEKELDRLIRIAAQSNDLGSLMPRDVARFAEAAFKMDRLLRGEDTERITTGPDLSSLSVEDLRELRRMTKKACA